MEYNNYLQYKLNEEEKGMLSYEFSKDYIYYALAEYQTKFNEIYRILINIFKKIFGIKKTNKNFKDDLDKLIEELKKVEEAVVKKYKFLLVLKKINIMDINKTDIYLEFSDENEKNLFIEKLKKRKELLEIFKKQMNELEEIKNGINYIYEKVISMNSVEITK